ncbi:thiol-disulfide oxidoreductase DCC family protein [Actinoplanes sp. CA-131856]
MTAHHDLDPADRAHPADLAHPADPGASHRDLDPARPAYPADLVDPAHPRAGRRDLDPAGHGAGRVAPIEAAAGSDEEGRIGSFTVLYDAGCPICRAAGRWLRGRAQLVPLEFVPAGSPEARERFAGLDHDATLRDITVIGDDGSVYVGDGAWVACLWALADYRAMAERISSPALLPSARKFIAAVSAIREATRSSAGPVGEGRQDWALDYGDGCDDRCR